MEEFEEHPYGNNILDAALNPCPFCNGKPIIIHHNEDYSDPYGRWETSYFRVECQKCGATTKKYTYNDPQGDDISFSTGADTFGNAALRHSFNAWNLRI